MIDFSHRDSDEFFSSKKEMEETAESYGNISIKEDIDYYDYYKNKYCINLKERIKDDLKDRLIELRPKTIEELKNCNILALVKIKTHGIHIIEEINKCN